MQKKNWRALLSFKQNHLSDLLPNLGKAGEHAAPWHAESLCCEKHSQHGSEPSICDLKILVVKKGKGQRQAGACKLLVEGSGLCH